MADTTFVDQVTKVPASWLNQINREVYGVSSVADIRNLDSTIYSRVRTLGYYANGGGGSGEYWHDPSDTTSADNGCTIIKAVDNARWKLIVSGNSIDILQAGASTTLADNAAAINTAIGLGYDVTAPAGTFKTGSSIVIKGNFRGVGSELTIIQPTAVTFPAFTNSGTNRFKYIISGVKIDYSVAAGGVAATNAAACGFTYTGTVAGQYDAEFTLEDIWMINPYTGFNDASLSYMYSLRGVRVDGAKNGFIKSQPGTTITLEHCYANGCSVQAYNFSGVNQLKLINCAFDNCTTSSEPVLFATCYGVSIIGMDFESNSITMNYFGVIHFDNCSGFLIDGLRGFSNTYAIGVNEGYSIYVSAGSVGTIKNAVIGTAKESLTVTGTGVTYPISIRDASSVFIESSSIDTLSGGGVTARGIACSEYAADASIVEIAANCTVPTIYSISATAKVVNRALPDVSPDRLNNSVTLTVGIDSPVQIFDTPLTVNQTATFAAFNLFNGARFKVVRTANATGAVTLTVNGAKALAAGQWVEYQHNGTAWFETSFGSL